MTNIDNSPDEPRDSGPFATDRRPLGMWLRVVDRLISREFAKALDDEAVSRRDWMVLNAVAGTIDAPGMTERLARGGKHITRLIERGWIARDDDDWTLTDTGRASFDRLTEKVDAVRAKVTGTLSEDEFAQLKASLEAMARGLGWDETQPLPHRRRGAKNRERGAGWGPYGHGHGFGGYGHEFGERRHHGAHPRMRRDIVAHAECEHGFEHGFEPGHRGFGPGRHASLREEFERRHHGRGHTKGDQRRVEHAYERGFAAGFNAADGRAAASTPPID